jgi:hypothetical protein
LGLGAEPAILLSDSKMDASGFGFSIDEELSEDNLVAVIVTTPSGKGVRVWSEVEIVETTIVLRQFAIFGVDSSLGDLGWTVIRGMARAALECFDVDCIRVEGARRTSGANPGRNVPPIEFRRRAR